MTQTTPTTRACPRCYQPTKLIDGLWLHCDSHESCEPTPERPEYFKFPQEKPRPEATQLWGITCNEGWRESIVCCDMYEWAADWLVQKLQGEPYAPGKH